MSNVNKNQWVKKSPISHGVYYPGPLQAGKANNKISSNKKAIFNRISKNIALKGSEKGKKFTDFYRVHRAYLKRNPML